MRKKNPSSLPVNGRVTLGHDAMKQLLSSYQAHTGHPIWLPNKKSISATLYQLEPTAKEEFMQKLEQYKMHAEREITKVV